MDSCVSLSLRTWLQNVAVLVGNKVSNLAMVSVFNSMPLYKRFRASSSLPVSTQYEPGAASSGGSERVTIGCIMLSVCFLSKLFCDWLSGIAGAEIVRV